MFDRIAPVYDAMNRVMTAGLDRRWRRETVRETVSPGDRVLDAACGTGDLAIEAARAGARVVGLDFSGAMLERARRKAPQLEWVQGDLLALPYGDGEFDAATVGFGIRNVADLEAGLRELRRVVRPGGRVGILEITRPRGALRVFYSLWFDRVVPLLGRVLPGGEAYTYLPASVRRFPGPEELAAAMRGAGFEDVRYRLFAGGIVALHMARMSGLATLKEAPGLTAFLDELEERLAAIVERGEGVVATIGAEALASGGKRLRPALCFLSSPLGSPPPFAAAAAVELLHMATLVHDDVLDAAELRRGRASAWAAHGPAAALAGGDHLFARAFAELAATGDEEGVRILAAAAVDLARGEAMQRRQLHDPDTPVDAYLERCCPQDGAAVRGVMPAPLAGRAPRRLRARARRRLPGRGRHPRLLRAHHRDREDPRHRPARRHADASAHPRRARGRGRPRGARGRLPRRCAPPRGRDGRARALARGRARLRPPRAGAPRRCGARGRARGPDPSRRRTERVSDGPAADDPGDARPGRGRGRRLLPRPARVRGAPPRRRLRRARPRRGGRPPLGGGRRELARARLDREARPLRAPSRSSPAPRAAGSASTGVDALYEELRAADVLHPVSRDGVSDEDYGAREFATLDADGNLVTFFEWVQA